MNRIREILKESGIDESKVKQKDIERLYETIDRESIEAALERIREKLFKQYSLWSGK